MSKKLTVIIIIILIISSCISLNSYASSNDFLEFKSCPTVSADASSSALKDITIKVTDNYGIKSVALKELDSNGKNPKVAKFSKTNKKSGKEHLYTLSHSKLLKGKTRTFSINVVNTKGYCYNATFKINVKTKKVNKRTVKYYSINFSPRVKKFSVSGNKLTFTVKDTGVYKTIQVADYNNNKNIAATVNDVKPGEATVSIDMANFRTDQNGFYNIKIVATENKSGYRLASNYELSFKLKTQNSPSSSGTTSGSSSPSSSETTGGTSNPSSSGATTEINIPAAQRPTSASQFKLYNTSNSNSNPRYLKSPVTGKTEKVQSFAITDIGTSKETIWYAFQTYNNNKYEQTLINAYRNNVRVYSAALNYGGEGQGVDIDKIGDNVYSIYCQRNEEKIYLPV